MTDKIEIPIEVSFSEKEEVSKIISELKDAKKEAVLPIRGKSRTSNRQAVPTLDTESLGGLEEAGIQVTPTRGRKDPLGLKKNKTNVLKNEFDKYFKEKMGKTEDVIDILSGKKTPFGFITKFIPHIAVALIAIGFVDQVVKIIFGPGGPLDKRLNEFKQRNDKLFSLKERALQKQGLRSVRISSFYGSRGGKDTVFSTLDPLADGRYLYDRDLNLLATGVTQ